MNLTTNFFSRLSVLIFEVKLVKNKNQERENNNKKKKMHQFIFKRFRGPFKNPSVQAPTYLMCAP